MKRRWTPEELDALLACYGCTATGVELARALGRSAQQVREKARASGLSRPQPRRWTPAEQHRLVALLEAGQPVEAIARQLGRSPTAIAVYRRVLPERPARPRTGRAVARLLGVCPDTVNRWLARGWLVGRRLGGRSRSPWVVVEDALLAFLADERHWQRWEPARVTDPAWREWLTELRADAAYLTVPEAARRLGYVESTVRYHIRCGRLPAVLSGAKGSSWRLRHADLEAFRCPSTRDRKRREFTPPEDAQLAALRRAGVAYAVIGRRLGRWPATVFRRWRQLEPTLLGGAS